MDPRESMTTYLVNGRPVPYDVFKIEALIENQNYGYVCVKAKLEVKDGKIVIIELIPNKEIPKNG